MKNNLIAAASLVVYLAQTNAFAAPAKITDIKFNGTTDPNIITITGDSPLSWQQENNEPDRQFVIEITDAQIPKSLTRKIDTSSFKSKVSLISPYEVPGQANTVRIVVQLREFVAAEVTAEGNSLKVSIPSGTGNSAEAFPAAPPATEQPFTDTPEAVANSEPPITSEFSAAPKTRLDEFSESQTSKNFSGKPISMNVRDVDAADVLRLIGEASGFNIVLTDDVKGKLTLSLTDVPWDQALEIVLTTMRLGAERNNNVLRITTLTNLTTEKTEQIKASQAAQSAAPRVTRMFPISYAKLADLQIVLSKFAVAQAGGTATTDTVVQVDERTNSILVRDTVDNIEKIKKLIEMLDTQTPQVMIEAKVVEATESFAKNISGNIGLSNMLNPAPHLASFNGANPINPLLGSPGVFASGTAVGTQSAGGGTFAFSPDFSMFTNNLRLNAVLTMGETENQLKVISSPKTVVLNKGTATIVQGTPVLVPVTTTTVGVGTSTGVSVQQANLSLNVTPTVTNDGSVLMTLAIARDVPVSLGGGQSGIGNRSINTQVLVESGTTLSIGGIYSMTTNDSSSGFPFLRKLPLLGWLFGNDNTSASKSELFIFITPRILNPKEAGMIQNNT